MLTLVRIAPVTRYVGRERVITNASCRRARRFACFSVEESERNDADRVFGPP
jgi:hypothetical protein